MLHGHPQKQNPALPNEKMPPYPHGKWASSCSYTDCA